LNTQLFHPIRGIRSIDHPGQMTTKI